MAKRFPRELGQSFPSLSSQPSSMTTQTELLVVEGKTRTSCGGLPIWRAKDDHGPSLPSLDRVSAGLP